MRTSAIAVHLDAGSLLVCEAVRKQGAGFEVHDGAPIAQTATVAADQQQQRVAVEIKQPQQSSNIWLTFHRQPLKSNSHHKSCCCSFRQLHNRANTCKPANSKWRRDMEAFPIP